MKRGFDGLGGSGLTLGVAESEKKSRKVSLKEAFGLYHYLGRYRGIFVPSLIALFVTAGLSLAFPYFLGSLIGGPQEALKEGVDVEVVKRNIYRVILS